MRGVVLLFAAIAAVAASGAAWLVATEEPADAASPGENGRIAFSSNRTTGEGVDNPERDFEIFTINPDGTGLAQVTHNANDELYPAWSPDGSRIAYVGHVPDDPDPKSNVYTIPAGGGEPVLVYEGNTYSPEWSPDGSKIAFAEETYGGCSPGFAIRTVPPGGGMPTKVVALAGSGPDGLDWGTSPWRTAPDTEPPAVLCTRPDEGRDDESTYPWVAADFSEELDPATITPATFYLTKEGSGERVGATVGCREESCRAVTLRVTERLDYDTAYTATIEGGADGVKDDAGNALAEDESWSFTTYDGIEPAVSLTAPTAGARVSGPGVTLSAEAKDRRGVKHVALYVENDPSSTDYVLARAGTFMLVKARTGERVAASVSCPAPCTEAELDPSAPLAANTRYRATVTTDARDTAGTALDQRADVAGAQHKVWSFTTGD